MKKLMTILLPSLLLFSLPALADKPLKVIELYTSQGCSSCPPADSNLAMLAKRDDVLALSFHVEYWDYIGWKDPFADVAHSRRQQDYARQFALRYVYTPQMVIDGRFEMTGIRFNEVDRALRKVTTAKHADVSIALNGQTLNTRLEGDDLDGSYFVIAVTYEKEHETKVRHGENRGRTLVNHNVVRNYQPVARWDGQPTHLDVDLASLPNQTGDAAAILVQDARTLEIIGAAALDLP